MDSIDTILEQIEKTCEDDIERRNKLAMFWCGVLTASQSEYSKEQISEMAENAHCYLFLTKVVFG